MSVYRCGTCKRKLIEGSTFCPNCEVFFSAPVPYGSPSSSTDVFIRPSDLTAHRSAKAFRNFAVIACLAALVLLSFMMGLDRSPIANLNALAHRPPSITDTMQADDEAARTRTLSAYTHAADVMVCVAAEATVRHRPVPSTMTR